MRIEWPWTKKKEDTPIKDVDTRIEETCKPKNPWEEGGLPTKVPVPPDEHGNVFCINCDFVSGHASMLGQPFEYYCEHPSGELDPINGAKTTTWLNCRLCNASFHCSRYVSTTKLSPYDLYKYRLKQSRLRNKYMG